MSFGVFAVFVYDSGRASYRRKNLGREESGIVRVLRDDGDSLERFVTSFPYGGLSESRVALSSLGRILMVVPGNRSESNLRCLQIVVRCESDESDCASVRSLSLIGLHSDRS